jgi:formiminoglutamase
VHRYLQSKGKQVVAFGVDGSRCSKQSDVQAIYMKQIRQNGFEAQWKESLAGIKGKRVHVSLNLESIDGAVGVSSNCLNGGFKTEEAVQMMFELGHLGDLVSIDLSEYNPCVEDWRTGRLAVTLFYYFALGLAEKRRT